VPGDAGATRGGMDDSFVTVTIVLFISSGEIKLCFVALGTAADLAFWLKEVVVNDGGVILIRRLKSSFMVHTSLLDDAEVEAESTDKLSVDDV
jgi:hypothetical protein